MTGEVRFVGTQDDRNVDTERAKVGHPEQSDSLVTVVIGVYEEDYVGLADLLTQRRSVLGPRRGVDNGCGDIFGSADARRDGDLRENGLDLIGDELVLDESGDEGGFAGALVAANTDAH